MPAACRERNRERDGDYRDETPDFCEGRDVLNRPRRAYTKIVGGSRDDNRDSSEIVHISAVGRSSRIMTRDANEILGECGRDRAKRCGANHHELRPPEQKRSETSPRFPDEYVDATGVRICSCSFGESQRSAEREESTGDPDGK